MLKTKETGFAASSSSLGSSDGVHTLRALPANASFSEKDKKVSVVRFFIYSLKTTASENCFGSDSFLSEAGHKCVHSQLCHLHHLEGLRAVAFSVTGESEPLWTGCKLFLLVARFLL